MIKVWSTYPPALWNHADGVRIVGGSISKLEIDNIPLDVDHTFPVGLDKKYIVWVRVEKPRLRRKSYTVKGSTGNLYTITDYGTRKTCTCPGFKFHGKCKHINAL